MNKLTTDVCVIGAGPAGCSTALFLDKLGVDTILVDKQSFPREKVCGELLRGGIFKALREVDANLEAKYLQKYAFDKEVFVNAVFSETRSLNFSFQDYNIDIVAARRCDFDNFLFSEAKEKQHIRCFENAEMKTIKRENGKILLSFSNKELQIESKLIIFANGVLSSVNQTIINAPFRKPQAFLGMRVHYKNVVNTNNSSDLFLTKELHQGFLGIAHLPNNEVNINLVMNAEVVREKGINVNIFFEEMLSKYVLNKSSFKNAKRLAPPKGAKGKIFPKSKKFSGDNYLLVGDAATCVHPITGFGVIHAIKSGILAAKQAEKSLKANDFSAKFLKGYDKLWWQKMGGEHLLSWWFVKTQKRAWLYKFLIQFLQSNFVRKVVTDSTIDKNLFNPFFYLKKLF